MVEQYGNFIGQKVYKYTYLLNQPIKSMKEEYGHIIGLKVYQYTILLNQPIGKYWRNNLVMLLVRECINIHILAKSTNRKTEEYGHIIGLKVYQYTYC